MKPGNPIPLHSNRAVSKSFCDSFVTGSRTGIWRGAAREWKLACVV